MARKIVVACGTAIATSTVVATKLKEVLRREGLSVPVVQCRVAEVAATASPGDIVVATAQVPGNPPVEVVSGVPFLTGIGEKEAIEKILGLLRAAP
ncbi:MAG: PTS sugar transporter subunit IIB [Clostridia bacterium]|nr:PTS sugar transporter subunit IIB [Clostridia bacterium]